MDRQDLARNLSDPRRNGFRATVRTALVLDLVAIIFIGVVGWLYLLCHADSIAIAHDGFLLTYWLERGALPAVALDFPPHLGKIAGVSRTLMIPPRDIPVALADSGRDSLNAAAVPRSPQGSLSPSPTAPTT